MASLEEKVGFCRGAVRGEDEVRGGEGGVRI